MHKCVNNTIGNVYHLEQWVDNFFPYSQKQLRFDQPVSIVFQSDEENASRMLGKTAYYDPEGMQVVLYTDDRHPKDVMRSLSHELVHHAQNCRGDFNAAGEMEAGYAQNDPHLRKMEREAYTKGNLIFRDFEDLIKTGKINIEIDFSDSGEPKMSLKEWKNDEINTKLMKKWGFLKEGRYEDGLADFMKDPSNLGHAGNHSGESCADVHPEDTAAAGGDPTKGHGDWQKRGGFEEWKAAQDLKEGCDELGDDEELEEGSAGDWSKMAQKNDPADLPGGMNAADRAQIAQAKRGPKVKAKRKNRAAGGDNKPAQIKLESNKISPKISVREAKQITRRIIERIKLENK
jgi:hypothetical protein